MSSCARCGHDPDAVVLATWSFFVDKEVASLNAHRVNAGARWQQAAYRRERDAWQTWMKWGRLGQRIPAATSRRRVTLVRVFGARQRPFDIDNLAGGLKSCTDAMVREGLLRGDDAASAEIIYDQRRGERVGLHVTIDELAATEVANG